MNRLARHACLPRNCHPSSSVAASGLAASLGIRPPRFHCNPPRSPPAVLTDATQPASCRVASGRICRDIRAYVWWWWVDKSNPQDQDTYLALHQEPWKAGLALPWPSPRRCLSRIYPHLSALSDGQFPRRARLILCRAGFQLPIHRLPKPICIPGHILYICNYHAVPPRQAMDGNGQRCKKEEEKTLIIFPFAWP